MISNVLEAMALIAMASAVSEFFAVTEASVPGWQRRVIMTVLMLGVAAQLARLLAPCLGRPGLAAAMGVVSGLILLAVPVSFWPLVGCLKRRRARILNTRLTRRAQRAEAAAAAARKWLDLAEQSGHVGHWQLTVPGNKLIWSDEMYRIHGLWRAHYKPRVETALAAFHPVDGKRIEALLREMAGQKERFEVSGRLRRPDGEIRHVILRGLAQQDPTGRVSAVNGVMVDVTAPRPAEARGPAPAAPCDTKLEDSLTGLADRRQFDLSLGYEFKRAVRSRKPLGMVLLEIDHFHAFIRHYGARERDACLRAVAQAVQTVPRRTGDVVARYSATEIAVLLPLADAAGAQRVAQAIAEAIRALGLPNATHDFGLLTVNCGAAAFAGVEDLYNPLELTRRAARALADARAAGGGRVAAFAAAELLETPA